MKRNILLFVLAITLAPFGFAQSTWNADPSHSNARFMVKHLGLAFVDGEFTTMEGNVVTTSEENFHNAVFNFTIDVNSINTRVEARDTHLKSADFFDVENHSRMTFKNAKLVHKKKNSYNLVGELTIRGVSKTVTFEVKQNNGVITDPWGLTRAGFTAKATIDRNDFGMNFGGKLPSGVEEIGSKVDIVVNLEIVKE